MQGDLRSGVEWRGLVWCRYRDGVRPRARLSESKRNPRGVQTESSWLKTRLPLGILALLLLDLGEREIPLGPARDDVSLALAAEQTGLGLLPETEDHEAFGVLAVGRDADGDEQPELGLRDEPV